MKRYVAVLAVVSLFFICTISAYSQMWAIRDISRVYYGRSTDQPLPADYNGDGISEVAVFRSYYGLWSIKGLTRFYLGSSGDSGVPADYNGDLSTDAGLFRPASGLWVLRENTRIYFGQTGDLPVSSEGAGDYNGDGTADVAIFRAGNGFWAVRGLTRAYWGGASDLPVAGDYMGDGTTAMGIFRPSSGLWAIRGITRAYFGGSSDLPEAGDYNGDGTCDIGIFRASSGLWAIKGVTRAYFGGSGDEPVPADYDGDGAADVAIFRSLTTPTPAPTPTPGPDTIYSIQHDGKTGTVTVTGIVSVVFPNMEFFIAEASGAYYGICVYQYTYGPKIGDNVTITGEVADYYGKTEIKNLTSFTINSRGNTPYAPVTITASQLGDEQYEGCMVRIDNVSVSNANLGSGKWQVSDGGGTATLDDELDYNYFPFNGDSFNSVAGIVERNTSQNPSQWLQPRYTADLDADKDVLPHYALYGDVVTMDDSHTVYDNYYIEVKGDLIEGITAAPPAGVDVIDVDGLIFPGLISTHDHASYDLFDFIPFVEAPNFVDRNAWAATQMYCDFKAQRNGFSQYYDEICKLMEVRMATSGGTVTQGQTASFNHSEDNDAKLGVGIINGERFPGRCYDKVVGTTDNDMASTWTEKHQDGVNGVLHRYIVHMGETTDKAGNDMAYQWNWWKSHDGFDGRDTIIHGMNIPAAEYALFDHGLDTFGEPLKTVLSWACKSNMLLYDETADISGALGQGATVALAPDWTESGMPNMLAELSYCKYVADGNAWNIQTREFIDMVTRNAAAGFSRLNDLGSIETGKIANFMVIDDGPGDPYDDLMMVAGAGASYDYRCGPKDVKLTIVAGRPIYGDDALLNTANFPFIYSGYIEDLTICSQPKKLTIARYNAGAYGGVDDLFLDYYNEMWTKYNYTDKYPCDFLSYDPAGAVPPTPAPTATPPAGTYVITSSSDDACQHVSYYTGNASYVYFGRHTVSEGYYAGFRFNNIAIPRGATITSAVLYLTQYTNYSSNQPILKVAADDVDDSATFSSSNGPMDRSGQLTAAQIDWTPAAGSSDVQFQSPDITSVVQEVINRGGWNSGNSLSIILAPNEAAVDHRRRVWAYDGAPSKAAQLVLEFSAATPTPTPFGFESPTPTPSVAPTATSTPTPVGYESPTPTVTPDTSNLLENSSFESWSTSTQPEDWTDGSYGDATYQQESGTVHSGSYSLKLTTTTDPGTYGDGIYQDQVVSVGQQYTFSAWLWAEQTGAMGITASWWDGSHASYWDTPTTTDAGEWNQWSIQSVAPAGTVSVRCWIRGFANTADCGYADDAVLSSP